MADRINNTVRLRLGYDCYLDEWGGNKQLEAVKAHLSRQAGEMGCNVDWFEHGTFIKNGAPGYFVKAVL